APGPTRVARIFVAPGQRVAEGDTLIEFERAPFDAAAQSAATALEAAQRNYARAVRLVQAGILPQKDADQAASELAQAQVAAVTVPVAALVPAAGGEGFQVFVVDSSDVVHVRPVTVGGRSEGVAEIVAGLAAGEVVVTNGAYGVADGARIARAPTTSR